MPSKKNSQLKEKLGEMSREDQIELWQCCYQLLMTEARPFLQERRSDDVEIEEKVT